MPRHRAQTPPTYYEIQVSGRIDPERAPWFGDMALTVRRTIDGSMTTVLSGQVPDQAALFGILSRIRDLGLRLISVNQVGPGTGFGPDEGPR
jgi:hypothetical protein